MFYKTCKTTWFFLNGEIGTQPCEVRIDGDEIVLALRETNDYEIAIWKGKEQGEGHYVLRREEGYGQAGLHRFAGGGFLEGYWEEDDDGGISTGMLRIELGGGQEGKTAIGRKRRGEVGRNRFTPTNPKCPKCKSKKSIPIEYGMPSPGAQRAARKGKVELGGCLIEAGNPNWHCNSCEHEWLNA